MVVATRTQLSRKARLAMSVLGLLLLIPAVLALRNCAVSQTSDKFVPPSGDGYEEIAEVGGQTMLLEPGSVGNRVNNWAKTGTGAYVFNVDDAIFEPGKATPTPDGGVRIARFARLMTAYPELHANVFVSNVDRADAQRLSLLQDRALQLRKALIASGIGETRIELTPRKVPSTNRDEGDGHSSIVVALAKQRN